MVGFLASIVGLVGWFGFKSLLLLGIATIVYVIELIRTWKSLNQGARMLIFIWAIVGGVIALFFKAPFYIGSMVAWNVESIISTLPMIAMFFKFFFK